MATKFTQSYKNNVIATTLNRAQEMTLEDNVPYLKNHSRYIAKDYGLATSTVGRWVRESKQIRVGNDSTMTTKEKRPRDWNAVEKLQAIIDCGALDDEAISAYCRQKGICPSH